MVMTGHAGSAALTGGRSKRMKMGTVPLCNENSAAIPHREKGLSPFSTHG